MEFGPELLLNGVLALLIIKEVLQFVNTVIKSRSASAETEKVIDAIKNMNEKNQNQLTSICSHCTVNSEKIDDMYQWHNARDEDGVFLWYVRQSLSRSLNELSKALLAQNDALRQLLQDNKDLLREENILKQVVQDNQKLIQNNQKSLDNNQSLIEKNRELIKDFHNIKLDLEKAASLAVKERAELERKIFEKMDQCFRKLNKE